MLLWLAFLSGINSTLRAAPTLLRGNLGIHDPSALIQCNGRYHVFGTGQGIISKSSADKTYWVVGPSVFSSPPAWTTSAVPGFTGFLWAPDVIYFNGLYHLYYAVSTFGSQVSAIGLATNPTLNPTDPSYQWTDQGPVIQSSSSVNFNAIDPSVTFDASGNLWMSLGSYWTGIKLIQLDPTTGLRISPGSTVYSLAYNSSIEASYLHYHDGYYYLFVNWGTCCSGVDSTYNIRVGRSSSITGPYVDENGVNMLSSGGTLFLKTTGKYIGPGQIGIYNDGTNDWFSYHYYNANANGAPMLDIEPLSWTDDGWPAFTNDWSAVYRFQTDARDDNHEFYGLMESGASVTSDPAMGGVLNLNGTNQFVSLPGGAANACTFIAVFKWNGGAAWQRVLDFGRGTNSYAFLTPQAYNGPLRFAITSSGNGNEQTLNSTFPATAGAWTQAAVTTDGSRGILYVNGTAVATNNSMTLTAPDIVPANVWFGRSQFSADPYFNGQISSVRLFGCVLSAAEIAAPQPSITAPSDRSHYQPGGSVQFSGNASDFADQPLAASALTWTVEFHDTSLTNVVLGPLSGVSGGSLTIPLSGELATNGFYRIILAATDSQGRSATNCVDVTPGSADWVASYPFQNGAAAASGNFNGTLVSGASTPSDPIRGPVLNLSGGSQYVNLPAGLGSMQTFSGWVKWNGGATWQRIFDFGTGTSSYAFLSPFASSGKLRFAITPDGSADERIVESPGAFPVGAWTHVAVALDGRQAVLFLNGQAVGVNASVNLLPSDVMGGANYLGRSQFAADPYFNGQMDSVQISSQCLPVEQITASTLGIASGATGVTLNWPSWNNGLVLHSAASLAGPWTTFGSAPVATNGINFLTPGVSNSQSWFRLQLP